MPIVEKFAAMDTNRTMNDVKSKIDREKRIMDGASAMRQSTPNPQLQAQADVQMRESRRNIEYLDGLLRDLQMRQGMDNMSLRDRNIGGRHTTYTGQQQSSYQPYGPDHVRASSGDGPDYGPGEYSDPRNPIPGPRRGPFNPPGPGGQPKGKPNYSKLGMILAAFTGRMLPHLRLQYVLQI